MFVTSNEAPSLERRAEANVSFVRLSGSGAEDIDLASIIFLSILLGLPSN
jgi:hypothetical protein